MTELVIALARRVLEESKVAGHPYQRGTLIQAQRLVDLVDGKGPESTKGDNGQEGGDGDA